MKTMRITGTTADLADAGRPARLGEARDAVVKAAMAWDDAIARASVSGRPGAYYEGAVLRRACDRLREMEESRNGK